MRLKPHEFAHSASAVGIAWVLAHALQTKAMSIRWGKVQQLRPAPVPIPCQEALNTRGRVLALARPPHSTQVVYDPETDVHYVQSRIRPHNKGVREMEIAEHP